MRGQYERSILSRCLCTAPTPSPFPRPLQEMAGRWCHRSVCLVLTLKVYDRGRHSFISVSVQCFDVETGLRTGFTCSCERWDRTFWKTPTFPPPEWIRYGLEPKWLLTFGAKFKRENFFVLFFASAVGNHVVSGWNISRSFKLPWMLNVGIQTSCI